MMTSPESPEPGSVMDDVEAVRLQLCDWLDDLEPDTWFVSSLCDRWAVKDVVAHLCLSTRESTWTFLRGMLRHRGNFDRMTAANAHRHADEFTPEQLVAQLRETAGSTATSLGGSPIDSLIDVIVHGQDIARPLDRRLTVPAERVVPALDHASASRWYGARKRFANTRLRASDVEWSFGSGTDEISGPAIDLLLVATGRSAALDGLSGSGVD